MAKTKKAARPGGKAVGRAGGGRATGTRSPRTRRAGSGTPVAFPRLKRRQGYGVAIVVVDATAETPESVEGRLQWVLSSGKGGGAGQGRPPSLAAECCGAIAAMGHPVRAGLLRKLLEGPATYQALRRVSKLEPGPLFFHIGQLRMAGLIMPKQRDLYELTRGGRNLILAMLAVAPMARDRRRCHVHG